MNEQYAKAAMDIIQLCRLTKDIVIYIQEAYELCHKSGKETELLEYLQSQHSQIMNQLSKQRNWCECRNSF